MRFALLMLMLVAAACRKETPPPRPTTPTVEQYRALALAVPRGDGELEKAAKAAREAPALPDRWVVLGQLWVRKARASGDPGQYLSASGAAQVALSLQPRYSGALALEALVALNQHQFRKARDLAKTALAVRADDLLALAALSDATLELGDVMASTEAVQTMIDLKPSLPSYGRAAHLRWLQGDSQGAQALYRQAIDAGLGSRDTEPLAWMVVQAALVFLDTGDVEGAEAGFDFALKQRASYPPALVGKARVLLARGANEEGAALLEQAVAASPLVETWVLLADARSEGGDFRGAAAAWAKAEKLGRVSDPLALGRGWAEASMHAAEAVKLLEREHEERPNVQVEGALAFALCRAGRLDEAAAASERALALGSSDARLRFFAAAISAARGGRSQALTGLEALAPRVAALSPGLRREAEGLLRSLKEQVAAK